jgi:hypothetical protein
MYKYVKILIHINCTLLKTMLLSIILAHMSSTFLLPNFFVMLKIGFLYFLNHIFISVKQSCHYSLICSFYVSSF